MIYHFKTAEASIGFDFDVSFKKDQKINCIIGKNGIGKTQLLENMAKALLINHAIFNQFKKPKSLYSDFILNENIIGRIGLLKIQLPSKFSINHAAIEELLPNKKFFDHARFIEIISNNNHKSSLAYQELIESPKFFDQPLVFIGAKNRGFTKNINPENIKILGSREDRFVEAFTRTICYLNQEGLEQQEIANWFVSRLIINPKFVTSDQNKSIEVETILKLMQKLEPSLQFISHEYGDAASTILYDNGRLIFNQIPLDKLSTGFISVIKIFQEIIAGYGGWSDLADLSLVKGVVFIDEIDAHLHISWQTKIIHLLKEFFPHTTFYITTHSPLVLAGLQGSEVCELYQEGAFVKAKAISNIDEYALNDIVQQFFGVDLNQQKIDHPNLERQKEAKRRLLDFLAPSEDESL